MSKEAHEPVQYEYVESLTNISKEDLEKFDVLVINLKKFAVGIAVDVIEIALNTLKPLMSVLFLFDNEEDHVEAIKYIGTLSKPVGFVSRQVYFEPEKPKIVDGFLMNTVYGLLLGKVKIFDAPIHIHNGDLKKNLSVFIGKLSPVQAKVGFLNEGNLSISCVHSEVKTSQASVVYFGCKLAVDKFLKTKDGVRATVLPTLSIRTSDRVAATG